MVDIMVDLGMLSWEGMQERPHMTNGQLARLMRVMCFNMAKHMKGPLNIPVYSSRDTSLEASLTNCDASSHLSLRKSKQK